MFKMNLPPGFRFEPTDEELVLHFLYPKLASLPTSHSHLIPQLHFYGSSADPYQLGNAFESNGQWYFYTRKTENRVTENGYWLEMDMEQPIFARDSNKLVGFKKCLVFYLGKFPSEAKTRWLMQEYHLCTNAFKGDINFKTRQKRLDVNKWVLCRVQEIVSNDNAQLVNNFHEDEDNNNNNEVELSCLDEVFLSLEDDQDEIRFPH